MDSEDILPLLHSLHCISRKRVTIILHLKSNIRTVIGLIFLKSVSLEPSIEREKGCTFMLSRMLLISIGATASFNIQVAFVEAEWYFDAILESGKIFLMVGDK